MNAHLGKLVSLALLLCAATTGPATAEDPWRFASDVPAGWHWQNATPESQGMSSKKLDELKTHLAAQDTKTFLVIRNDKIVYEWYASDYSPTKKHGTASLAKALVGGLSLGIALTDKRIALDDKVAKYVPQWASDPRKSQITVRELGSHTSGLDDAESKRTPHDQLTGWKGAFWKQESPPNDPFSLARDLDPVIFDPGTRIQYSNPGIAMLTYAVAASMRDAPVDDVRVLLRDRVFRPIGIPDDDWTVGYGKTTHVDGLPLVGAWGGASLTARAAARIGRLVIREGDWEGRQILSKEAVRQVTGDAGLPGGCGMGWWTNAKGRYPYFPREAVWGAGAGDQVVLVIPSLRLIMVRNGKLLKGGPTPAEALAKKMDVFEQFHDPRAEVLFKPLIEAITDRLPVSLTPYPQSKLIAGIRWAPVESIVQSAKDSDNWPLAWGDDDLQYTAYGDGTGFVPKVPEKLSMGFARIQGDPKNFVGINIRSRSGETKGNGKAGKKASGMLMVDGVLFMWVRNAGNSQLAWSVDKGETWNWSDWKFTQSFGYPTFIEFGKNYTGARDGFVYVVSSDTNTAYVPADRLILARVPKHRIKERGAYEFCVDPNARPAPAWSPDLSKCGTIFDNPGRCYRCNVSFNAGLKRYLLCQAGADRNVNSGFGIFDAPEPWGPWTTITYQPRWDVDPGESASFPTKWMSADGRMVHLVFSGGDRFNVRQAELLLSDGIRAHKPAGDD